ncbi:MAG: sugar ABC transporter permease [Chloroflexi bacterium]|nr:sugar ABC transporter permease [Chloroflexota bacterium]
MTTVAQSEGRPTDTNFQADARRRKWRQAGLAYLYILPAALIMIFITFYPIGYQIYMSFTDFTIGNLRIDTATVLPTLLNPPEFLWLENYVRVITGDLALTNYSFVRILTFNLLWTFVNVFLHVAIGIAIAIALDTKDLPNKRLYRSLFVIPWALPSLVSGMIWANMWHDRFGGVNLLLQRLGLPGDTRWLLETQPFVDISIAGEPVLVLPLAFIAALVANVWLGWPFMMVIATGALQSIPREVYEAAEVDGASKWQQFWRITLPLIRPAMVPAVMIGIMLTFNQFNVIFFVTGGGPLGLTEILVTQGFKLVNPQNLFGVASAFNIIVFFILVVLTLITNRVSRATEPYYA